MRIAVVGVGGYFGARLAGPEPETTLASLFSIRWRLGCGYDSYA